jgi:hypothetical protein
MPCDRVAAGAFLARRTGRMSPASPGIAAHKAFVARLDAGRRGRARMTQEQRKVRGVISLRYRGFLRS